MSARRRIATRAHSAAAAARLPVRSILVVHASLVRNCSTTQPHAASSSVWMSASPSAGRRSKKRQSGMCAE
eukprot:3219678-Prymnesium_polylepis.1